MAANSLGLFVFILGMAGISKVDSYYRSVSNLNMRSLPHDYDDLYLENMRERSVLCSRLYLCNELEENLKNNLKSFHPYFKKYYLLKDPISLQMKKTNLKKGASKLLPESVEISHDYVDFEYTQLSARTAVASTQQANERHSTGRPNLSTSVPQNPSLDRSRNTIVTGSTLLIDHFLSDLKVTDRKVSDMSSESSKNIETKSSLISESVQKTDTTTLKPESKFSSFGGKVDLDLVQNKNEFITINAFSKGETVGSFTENKQTKNVSEFLPDTFTEKGKTNRIFKDNKEDLLDQTSFPEYLTNVSHSETQEIEGENTPRSVKTNSREEFVTASNNEIFQTKSTGQNSHHSIIISETSALGDSSGHTKFSSNKYSEIISHEKDSELSTMVPNPISTVTREDRLSDVKTGSSVFIQSTSNKGQSTVPQNIFFTTPDADISSKSKPSFLEEVNSRSTEHFETESTISPTESTIYSTTLISDDNELPKESSFSLKLKSTTYKTEGIKSTSETFIPSIEVISTQSIKTVTKDNTKKSFSTESSSKTYFPSKGRAKDHIIEIPAIHTARVVITSIFLVIALIAITVLAVYIFRLKRREVQYDQLRLIP